MIVDSMVPVVRHANLRNVWKIPTHSFSGAHFATFPPALAKRCILAGTSAAGVCAGCGAPWVRQVRRTADKRWKTFREDGHSQKTKSRGSRLRLAKGEIGEAGLRFQPKAIGGYRAKDIGGNACNGRKKRTALVETGTQQQPAGSRPARATLAASRRRCSIRSAGRAPWALCRRSLGGGRLYWI